MKLHLPILVTLTLLFVAGCGTNSQKQSDEVSQKETKTELKEGEDHQTQANDKNSSDELLSATQVKETGSITIRAQFEMMVANTAGTFVVFKAPDDEEGVWYRIADETNDLDFAMGLRPGDSDSEYSGKWYEITYEMRTENRKGREQERPFILSAREVGKGGTDNAPQPAITFEDLKNAIFFGTEPFWSVEFKNSHMFYQDGPGQEKKRYNYVVESGISSPVKAISENAVQVNVWPAINGTDSYQRHIIIRKEPCSDGMSDNTYPYSIEINREDTEENGSGEIGKGCGRITNNLVKIEDIEQSQKIKNYTVAEVTYEPQSHFNIVLDGTFDFRGHFTINPMSDMLDFHVDENQRPGIDLKIGDFSRPLFASFHFTNEPQLKAVLGDRKMKQIRNGEQVKVNLVFRNYQVGGKIDGYGGASAEFVKLF
ncbi:hypothetical protein [Marinilabilia rubra]|uniref:Uncharacterized protein n=1 Tax=Marinilabilia rubra TaxID=2162893 RepID=A0A2U2B8E8_9BACT|nr:hypothetical protein [Marinilabilia rubra]PWD99338.1 hypothetical protein DDZ16_10010 [Marinilabilia rubra]